jgi:site-specific DNA-methyltransferase (adenine-specific)
VTDDVRLYLGDCLDVLRDLPDGSVDAVVTDPPFGIGFKYSQHDDSPEGYGEWLWSALSLAEAKCKPGSPVFVWQAMPNVRRFAEWFPREWRLFAACKNFVQMRPTAMQYAYDPVVVWWVPGEKPYSSGTLSRDFFVANTSPSARRGLNDVHGHPCPRPLDLMLHVVDQWVRPGGTVLDPFAGSGTTGVACVQTGRKFIGVEIDPTYYRIAERRIAEARAQLPLPIGEAAE